MSRMVFSLGVVRGSGGRGYRVLLCQEAVDRTIEAYREVVDIARAACSKEVGEVLALIEHKVVVHAVDALLVEQTRNDASIRTTERDVRDPVRYARSEVVGRRHVTQGAAFHDDEVV